VKRIEILFLIISILLIFSFIFSFFLNNEQATRFWALATDLGDERLYIFISVSIFFFYPSSGIILLVAVLLSGTLNLFLKYIFDIPRPPNPKIPEGGPSFPSNHAQSSGVFWASANLLYRSIHLIFLGIIWITFISYSRVFLNVHYPFDVIGGSLIGIGFGSMIYLIHQKSKANQMILNEVFLIIVFIFCLLGFFLFRDLDFARRSFFALGFATLFPFLKENPKSRNTIIAYIVWLIIALPLLAITSLNLYLQYYLLGLSAPLIKYLISKLSK